MKQSNKLFSIMLMMLMATMAAHAEGGLLGSVNTEGAGIIAIIKTVVIIMLLLIFFLLGPIASFFAIKIAKKQLKNEQDENAGITVYAIGAVAMIVGFYIGYWGAGFMGSMMDKSSGGVIDLPKGTNYVISKIFQDLETISSGG